MADLVMEVHSATARREGDAVVVSIEGEQANSRDKVFTDTEQSGSAAEVNVRIRPADGMGTQITGSFSVEARINNAAAVKTVRVRARNGTKTVSVS